MKETEMASGDLEQADRDLEAEDSTAARHSGPGHAITPGRPPELGG